LLALSPAPTSAIVAKTPVPVLRDDHSRVSVHAGVDVAQKWQPPHMHF
jgi:hypothetical protein